MLLEGEENPDNPRSLAAKPRWQRFIVLVSGAAVNLVLPVLLFAIAFTLPHEESVGRAVITTVVVGGPAEAAGLRNGDVIYEVGGRTAKNVNDAGRLVRLNLGNEIDILVKRGSEFVAVTVTPRWTPPGRAGADRDRDLAAVRLHGDRLAAAVGVAAERAARHHRYADTGAQPDHHLGEGRRRPAVRRPRRHRPDHRRGGASGRRAAVFELAALLSINLGIINLLPLPMLDGGRIFFLLLEVVRRGRRVAPEKEALVHLVGLALFIALAAVITFADISRIVSGESVFR